MAHIVGYLSVGELEARYRASQDVTEARHLQAIWLLAQGWTVLEVAEVLAFVPRWVEQLAARYNASGPEALGDRRRRNGRPASLLTPELLAALAARLKKPPDDGGVWSGPKAAAWMARHLGRAAVHPQRGWEALKRVRWSIQAPRHRVAIPRRDVGEADRASAPAGPRLVPPKHGRGRGVSVPRSRRRRAERRRPLWPACGATASASPPARPRSGLADRLGCAAGGATRSPPSQQHAEV